MNTTSGIVTITIAGLVAGTIITITAPPGAAIIMVLGVAAITAAGYFNILKSGG